MSPRPRARTALPCCTARDRNGSAIMAASTLPLASAPTMSGKVIGWILRSSSVRPACCRPTESAQAVEVGRAGGERRDQPRGGAERDVLDFEPFRTEVAALFGEPDEDFGGEP